MNEGLFLKQNRPQWQRLENYAARLAGRGEPLDGADLFALVSLYRKSTGDLARARMLRLHPDVIDYLNSLVGRVHALVYAPPPYPWGRVFEFFRSGFPSTVRRHWRYVLGATLLLLLPADTTDVRWGRSLFFLIGALFSAVTGFTGMSLTVRGNVRVAAAAKRGAHRA